MRPPTQGSVNKLHGLVVPVAGLNPTVMAVGTVGRLLMEGVGTVGTTPAEEVEMVGMVGTTPTQMGTVGTTPAQKLLGMVGTTPIKELLTPTSSSTHGRRRRTTRQAS